MDRRRPNSLFGMLMLSGLVLLGGSSAASAGVITVLIDGNDCAGFFGLGFENCNVAGLSPVIIKFDESDIEANDGGSDQIHDDLFPTISGSEWSFTGSGSSGTWTYTPDDAEDPDIRYFAVKGGPDGFNFHYFVPDASQAFCSTPGNEMLLACLSVAEVIPTSTAIAWSTGSTHAVSHINFYDTGRETVPEPGTFLLVMTGAFSLAARRRACPSR